MLLYEIDSQVNSNEMNLSFFFGILLKLLLSIHGVIPLLQLGFFREQTRSWLNVLLVSCHYFWLFTWLVLDKPGRKKKLILKSAVLVLKNGSSYV